MKNNLLTEEAVSSIITRVGNLTFSSKPKWGEMNALEMLLHCNSCNRQILVEGRQGKTTSLKQYLLRILALYIAPKFKKGLESEPRHIVRAALDLPHFEEQKKEFVETIKKFPSNKRELTLTHPAFGNISTQQWGIAAYKHMDHHLRQFNV